MAKIIVGKNEYTDGKAAVEAISQTFGITERAALCHLVFGMKFENDTVCDEFIDMIEEKVSDVSDYDYIKMFLEYEGSVDIEFKEGDCLEQITDIMELLF